MRWQRQRPLLADPVDNDAAVVGAQLLIGVQKLHAIVPSAAGATFSSSLTQIVSLGRGTPRPAAIARRRAG